MLLLMTTLIFRLYYINESDYITMAATAQGKYRLNVAQERGNIYDRSMSDLVNEEYRYVASVIPTPQAAAALLEITPDENKNALMSRLTDGKPFVMEIPDNSLYAEGIDVFRVPRRYGPTQIAPHLIGYLGNDGADGVAGIEKAYNELLQSTGGTISISYQADAVGHLMQSSPIGVQRDNEGSRGGVVLSLDKNIQQLTLTALQRGCEKGAAVVMDVNSGDILAMASIPTIDANNISASLESTDSPFLNRAICGYNIGSVFKIVMSAAALESGISPYEEHECVGYTNINGQVFRCNFNAVHGKVDMQRALEVSCNSYFISLTDKLEPEYVLSVAQHLGIGTHSELAPGIITQPGNLPQPSDLAYPAAYANFSFGQGSSLATPLQMAQIVSTVANSGYTITPRLVLGTTDDGQTLTDPTPIYTQNRVISEKTAKTIQSLMISVIEEGSGKNAKPFQGSAGGKTSSAQTGQYIGDEEIVHAWFAGFYPAEQPKYSIVIFVEGGESGEIVAGPIFKEIADGIARVESGSAKK